MGKSEPTVYEYSPDQHLMLRLYELRTAALVGRNFHEGRAKFWRILLRSVDAVATVTSSAAFVGLTFWKTAMGSDALAALIFIAAVAGIIRIAFRMDDFAESSGFLARAWKEVFMDLDQVLHWVKRSGGITDKLRSEMDFACERFRRIESLDDVTASKKKLAELQDQAEAQLAPEKQWLPS